MRVDKYINAVNIVKRRAIADDMCKSGVVHINDKQVKSAKEVKEGDIIKISYTKGDKEYQVLKIPTTKTISKSQKDEYVQEL